MKRSFAILVIVLLALLAAALAPMFKSDPGLVQVHIFGWTIETSVLVLAIAVLLIWLVAAFLLRLWRLPAEAARRMGDQRALAHLEKGLLALTEGDWRTAERALEKSTNAQGKTTARYLAAAQAADGQDEADRAEWYLEQAEGGGRKQRFIVALTRARILCGNQRYREALPLLEDLQKRRKRHTQVLELLTRCYRELGDWDGMQRILPALKKAGIVDEEKAQELSLQAAVSKLRQSVDLESLASAWQGLNKPTQRLAEVVRAYSERAIELGEPQRTEAILRASLKREWSSALLIPYGVSGPEDAIIRLKQCEKWLKLHPEDAMLQLALGRLCAGEQLWGKAREHMIRSLELEPSIIGYDSLGQLLERMGELETAMACFRNALRMSQGKQPEPLPGDPAKLTPPE
jgi:HemY protein